MSSCTGIRSRGGRRIECNVGECGGIGAAVQVESGSQVVAVAPVGDFPVTLSTLPVLGGSVGVSES
ncbi:hypothetical protein PP713_03165 [Mycobacterium sp. CSUR Q5927]|nr:hypothetical protein [Mycobacterium sp. CSUR Q5927]